MYVYSFVCLDCLYIYIWLSLLQAWVFQHSRCMSNKDVWGGYRERQHPHAIMHLPLRDMSTPNKYKEHLDQLDLASVSMAPYVKYRHACLFKPVILYSRWLRYGARKVRYLSEQMLRQFGHRQTVLVIHMRVHLFR
jgi:hypothetical protein